MHDARTIWDQWNRSGGPRYPNSRVVQFMFRSFPEVESRGAIDVLDLGCGGGVHMRLLIEEGFSAHGCDISPVALAQTAAMLERSGLEAQSLTLGTVAAIPHPDASFRIVISIGVFECAPSEHLAVGLSEIRRVLAPGGSAFLMFASDRDFRVLGNERVDLGLHGFSDPEVHRALDAAWTTRDTVQIDRSVFTYRGGSSEQNEHVLTLIKAIA